jgi:hypothetical protein
VNNSTLNTSENISQKIDDDDENQQQSSRRDIFIDASTTQIKLDENTKKPKPKRRKKNSKQQEKEYEKTILSNDSKLRAQILLEKLAEAIENRSKQSNSNPTHPHSSFLGVQHYKDDQHFSSRRSSTSTPDPFTNKLPPKSQRRSLLLKKNLNQNDHTTTNDTS